MNADLMVAGVESSGTQAVHSITPEQFAASFAEFANLGFSALGFVFVVVALAFTAPLVAKAIVSTLDAFRGLWK